MNVEQVLLEKWRSLAPEQQQEVFDFMEVLQAWQEDPQLLSSGENRPKLGEQLRQIRNRIIASKMPLLTDEEIEQELAERRGGYQESE